MNVSLITLCKKSARQVSAADSTRLTVIWKVAQMANTGREHSTIKLFCVICSPAGVSPGPRIEDIVVTMSVFLIYSQFDEK